MKFPYMQWIRAEMKKNQPQETKTWLEINQLYLRSYDEICQEIRLVTHRIIERVKE